MATAQELVRDSLAAYGKGQAIIALCDEKKIKPTAEQIAEANKFFDEADALKLKADEAHGLTEAEKKLRERTLELKRWADDPQRRVPLGGDDDPAPGDDEGDPEFKAVLDRIAGDARRETLSRAIRHGDIRTYHTLMSPEDSRFVSSKAFDRTLTPKFKHYRSAEYKAAFEAYLRFSERGINDAERKALSTLTDTEGGFLVTEEFRTEVIRKLRNLCWIRQYARVIQTSAAAVGFPTFDPTDAQTLPPVAIPNQAGAVAALTNLFGKVQFLPHKRMITIPVPLELIEDAVVDVSALLTDFFALRFAETEENDFINGTGVNQPLGLVSAPNMPSINIAGSTTAMVPEDLVKTVYAMRAVYRRDASWLMHRLVIQAVRLFRTNIGGAGTGSFMFQPSMQAGEPPTLMGFRLLESEFMPNPYTGSAGTPMALFGNLGFYWIVDRIDLMVQRLNELYAGNDQVGFKMRKRYDGAPVLADPFQFLTRQ